MTYETRALETAVASSDALIRNILESVCRRDGLSLESGVNPGEPARNYELAMRLGIGHVFGIDQEAAVSPGSRWRAFLAWLNGWRRIFHGDG